MTIMRVSVAGAELTSDIKRSMAGELIAEFAEVETGTDDPAVHAGFVVHFEQVGADDLYMGSAPMVDAGTSGRAVVLTAQVMAGPWTNEMKAELFARLEAVVRRQVDMPRSGGGADFWMTITEIPEGAWGYGGRPVSIGSLAPAFSDPHRQRIEQYLAETETSAS